MESFFTHIEQNNIVKIKINKVAPTEKEMEHYLDFCLNVVYRKTDYVLLMDLSDADFAIIKQSKKIASFFKSHTKQICRYCKGFVYVIDSAVPNIIIKGLFALQEPPVKSKICSNMKQALIWSKEQLS